MKDNILIYIDIFNFGNVQMFVENNNLTQLFILNSELNRKYILEKRFLLSVLETKF